MLNTGSYTVKESTIEKMITKIVLIQFGIMFAMVFFDFLLCLRFNERNYDYHYIFWRQSFSDVKLQAVQAIVTFFLLFN